MTNRLSQTIQETHETMTGLSESRSVANVKKNVSDALMKLVHSASAQNVYTYVCLIKDIKPSFSGPGGRRNSVDERKVEEKHIKVERSKALHELVEEEKSREGRKSKVKEEIIQNDTSHPTTSHKENKSVESDEAEFKKPNILKLTKMKWLSEGHDRSSDASSSSMSPSSSNDSVNSLLGPRSKESLNEKCLSTILKLDKEHNLFGLSDIAIVGSKQMKRSKRNEEKPVFHQTAIVQVCCANGCCRNKSKTDLPSSLKCGGCRVCSTCCVSLCSSYISFPRNRVPRRRSKACCRNSSSSPKYMTDYSTYFGFKIVPKRKPDIEPEPCEITPRSSSVLQKPYAARSCHHVPRCVPPSSHFPYLMPCYWPSRPSAPCSHPSRCFHNPPCPAPRPRRRPKPPADALCPKGKSCISGNRKKCPNDFCPGNIPSLVKAIETKYGKGQ